MKRYGTPAVLMLLIFMGLNLSGQDADTEEPVPPDSRPETAFVHPNTVSWFVMGTLYGTFSVSYERTLSSLLGLELRAFYHTPVFGFSPGIVAPGVFFEWYGIGLNALVYPGESLSDGLFVTGGLEAGWWKASGEYSVTAVPSDGAVTLELSFGTGYRFRFGRFAVAPQVQWAYVFTPGSERAEVLLNTVVMSGEIAVSWIF